MCVSFSKFYWYLAQARNALFAIGHVNSVGYDFTLERVNFVTTSILIPQLTWPRTVTERLLSEMFEGGAAQFLAVLEALTNTQRRALQTGPSSADADMNDVTSELFFAGKEIVAGLVVDDVCCG